MQEHSGEAYLQDKPSPASCLTHLGRVHARKISTASCTACPYECASAWVRTHSPFSPICVRTCTHTSTRACMHACMHAPPTLLLSRALGNALLERHAGILAATALQIDRLARIDRQPLSQVGSAWDPPVLRTQGILNHPTCPSTAAGHQADAKMPGCPQGPPNRAAQAVCGRAAGHLRTPICEASSKGAGLANST
eukprot:1156756-Pelagomonas_calceolata.AAC.3